MKDLLLAFRRSRYNNPPVMMLAFMVLFWTMFDSTMQYLTPLFIERAGFSNTWNGLIIGSSSVTGAIFDFLVCKLLKNTNFRRVFLAMFTICAVYPLLLWSAKGVWTFLFAMAVWGVYYDLYGFGTFNLVGHYSRKVWHATSFGMVYGFRALGGLLVPLIIGFSAGELLGWDSLYTAWTYLAVGLAFFIALFAYTRRHEPIVSQDRGQLCANASGELRVWVRLARRMWPVLAATFFLFLIEAFFWTLAPIYAESVGEQRFGGLFLTAFVLPLFVIGLFVDNFTSRLGKKRTAFLGLFAGCLTLVLFYFSPYDYLNIVITFVAACFIGVCLPSVNGAYADFISETPSLEREIEAVEDFSFNAGYILGPMLAGFLADLYPIPMAFAVLGVGGAILALTLLIFAPRHIRLDKRLAYRDLAT